jgi:hypothetical protein
MFETLQDGRIFQNMNSLMVTLIVYVLETRGWVYDACSSLSFRLLFILIFEATFHGKFDELSFVKVVFLASGAIVVKSPLTPCAVTQ